MSLCDSLPEIPSDDVDLGLGFGLRPGSLPPTTTSTSPSSISTFIGTSAADLFTWASVDSLTSAVADEDKSSEVVSGPSAIKARMSGMFGRISEKFRPKKYQLKSDNESECSSPPWTPDERHDMQQNTGIVSLGTSLRQQRMLYEQDLAEIQRRQKIESNCQLTVTSGMAYGKHSKLLALRKLSNSAHLRLRPFHWFGWIAVICDFVLKIGQRNDLRSKAAKSTITLKKMIGERGESRLSRV